MRVDECRKRSSLMFGRQMSERHSAKVDAIDFAHAVFFHTAIGTVLPDNRTVRKTSTAVSMCSIRLNLWCRRQLHFLCERWCDYDGVTDYCVALHFGRVFHLLCHEERQVVGEMLSIPKRRQI